MWTSNHADNTNAQLKKATHHLQIQRTPQSKICERHNFLSTKKNREVSYLQCGWRRLSELFLVVLLVAGSRGFWKRVLQSCHCVLGTGRGGESLFELRVNAVKMAKLAYLHPGNALWDCVRHFYVTRLTRLPLISPAEGAFNTPFTSSRQWLPNLWALSWKTQGNNVPDLQHLNEAASSYETNEDRNGRRARSKGTEPFLGVALLDCDR